MLDQIILFGDSITQQSFSQERGFAFGAELSNQYVRKLDVVNRGLSGYNTAQALKVLPQVISSPKHTRIRLLTVFLGANDARLPDTPGPSQHISPSEYSANLKAILNHPCLAAHKDLRIILMTPPPVDERMLRIDDKVKYPDYDGLRRTAETTKHYADLAREVGREFNGKGRLVVCDVWSRMMGECGWKEGTQGTLPGSEQAPVNEKLVSFVHDGLHFTPAGYQVVYDELMATIEKHWPDLLPDNIPMALPAWDDHAAWKDI